MKVEIGKRYKVGKFFWAGKCIGFANDAKHGHGLTPGGSMDVTDEIEVLGFESYGDLYAVAKAIKHAVPYGAPCAHGMVFLIPVSQIEGWEQDLEAMKKEREELGRLAGKYGVAA